MKNDDLRKFLLDWDFWASRSETQLEEPVLECLLLRQLRKCTQLRNEVSAYDNLPPGDQRRGYTELLDVARRHLANFLYGDDIAIAAAA